MTNKNKPSGVIFDFDGVVVDSLAAHLTAWQISYEKLYGETLLDTKGLPGRSTSAIAEILAVRAGRPQTATELSDLKRQILKSNQIQIKLLPGAKGAFHWLEANLVPYGIASNAPRDFIASTLSQNGLQVQYLFGSDDVSNPKPAPDVFLKCAQALKIGVMSHAEIIVFEDSPHGLRAAVKAGMFPIGVLTQNGADEMLAAGARAVCKNVEDALSKGWLERLPI